MFPIVVFVILTMLISSVFVAHFAKERRSVIQSLVGPVCENWDPPVRAPTCDSSRVLRTALRDENCRVAIQSPSSIAAKLTKLADGSPFVFFRGIRNCEKEPRSNKIFNVLDLRVWAKTIFQKRYTIRGKEIHTF